MQSPRLGPVWLKTKEPGNWRPNWRTVPTTKPAPLTDLMWKGYFKTVSVAPHTYIVIHSKVTWVTPIRNNFSRTNHFFLLPFLAVCQKISSRRLPLYSPSRNTKFSLPTNNPSSPDKEHQLLSNSMRQQQTQQQQQNQAYQRQQQHQQQQYSQGVSNWTAEEQWIRKWYAERKKRDLANLHSESICIWKW